MEFNKGITKREESDALANAENGANSDGFVPKEFFSCFFAFYNGIKMGKRDIVTYNLNEMKKYMSNIKTSDACRLAYINLVHCFSMYLGEEYVEQYLEIVPVTAEEACVLVGDLADRYFEKLRITGDNSGYIKREILQILENEFSNPLLSVSMLADRLGISASYLSRYFKEKTGVTLFSYIDEMRIAKAKELLVETDAPVKEIVKTVGYNDINNFNRKFKSKTGQTPSSYRK